MKIGIAVASEAQKQEIASGKVIENVFVQWVGSTRELLKINDADYWIDCTFSEKYVPFFEKPTLIHAPVLTLANSEIHGKVGRFCSWNTFLQRKLWEVSIVTKESSAWVEDVMRLLDRKPIFVNDECGLVAPRVVCTIINEAYHALQAGISSAEEIDIAMKLGTNYPYGPLEWSRRIGIEHVYDLLQALAKENSLYTPAFKID